MGAIPTSTELTTNGFHVYNNGASTGLPSTNNWILASFTTAVFEILVFPIMDHLGFAYDGYQYTIYGSNNRTAWTPLFDAFTVTSSGEPFTLGTFTGTPPNGQ